MSQVLFLTDRLGCRRWTPEDLADIYLVYSDEEGARWVDDGKPITLEECERWMAVTLNNYETRGYGMFTVYNRSSGQTVGFCGLVHPQNQPDAEIKYSFLKNTWGNGYASEVVPAMLDFAASVHDLNKVIATVAAENAASIRVLEKSGMNFVETTIEDDGSQVKLYEWRHTKLT